MSGFEFLLYLDLSNKSFSGNITESLTRLSSFIDYRISLSEPLSSIPLLLRNGSGWHLQYNEYWNLPLTLALSYNNIIGPGWPCFGNLRSLQVLDLGYNNLSGGIPDSLSRMESLEVFYLCYNHLSGTIPDSLAQLTFFSALDVSYNNLSGKVSSRGQFLMFPISSFEGNEGLCGVPLNRLQEDHPTEAESECVGERFANPPLAIQIGGAFGFVVTTGFCFTSGWVNRE